MKFILWKSFIWNHMAMSVCMAYKMPLSYLIFYLQHTHTHKPTCVDDCCCSIVLFLFHTSPCSHGSQHSELNFFSGIVVFINKHPLRSLLVPRPMMICFHVFLFLVLACDTHWSLYLLCSATAHINSYTQTHAQQANIANIKSYTASFHLSFPLLFLIFTLTNGFFHFCSDFLS